MKLLHDLARCAGRTTTAKTLSGNGVYRVPEGECVRCRRREPGHPDHQTHLEPPAFIQGKCPQRIAP